MFLKPKKKKPEKTIITIHTSIFGYNIDVLTREKKDTSKPNILVIEIKLKIFFCNQKKNPSLNTDLKTVEKIDFIINFFPKLFASVKFVKHSHMMMTILCQFSEAKKKK